MNGKVKQQKRKTEEMRDMMYIFIFAVAFVYYFFAEIMKNNGWK